MSAIAFAAFLTFAGAAAQVGATDPYAATAPGWSHCFTPNVAEKTCQSIVTYQPAGNHTYDSHVVSALSLTDFIVEYDERFTVVDGEVCSPVTWTRHSNVRYRRGERYLEGPEAAAAQQAYRARYTGAGDVQLCGTISGEGNDLVATVKAMGEPSRGYRVLIRTIEVPLRWIHEDDGYTVAAWSAVRS